MNKKKRREVDKNFVLVMLVLTIVSLGIYSVFAAYSANLESTSSINDSDTFLINITLNSTIGGATIDANITQFNVTFPSNFTYEADSNDTDTTIDGIGAIFTNTSTVVNWYNKTGYLTNGTNNGTFWFNVTPSLPGTYNLIVRYLNATGSYNPTNLSITVNDTTPPNVTINFPANNENVSAKRHMGTAWFNVTIGDYTNVSSGKPSVWFNISNSSGGNGTMLRAYNMSGWGSLSSMFNYSFNTTLLGYADGWYNVTVIANDSLNNLNNSERVQIIIDNTAPNMTNITSPIRGANYSGTITLNASVDDVTAGMGEVWFNLTYLNGSQAIFIPSVKSNTLNLSYYNSTFNTANVIDGTYNVTVWANDSANNLNNSAIMKGYSTPHKIIIDNTAPSIEVTRANHTKTTLGLSIRVSDATSGVNGRCTADRSGASIGGGTTDQALFEKGLGCGQSYVYKITCSDYAGNSGTLTTASFSTTACGLGSSGGGGSGTFTKTYNINEESLNQGYTKALAKSERIKFNIGKDNHQLSVKSLTESTVTIEVSSTPQEATLSVGDERKFDIDDNGYYDLYVKLNKIESNKADITIKSISEKVTEQTETQQQEQQEAATGQAEEDLDTGVGSAWLWIIIVVIVILILVVIGYVIKKKKQ